MALPRGRLRLVQGKPYGRRLTVRMLLLRGFVIEEPSYLSCREGQIDKQVSPDWTACRDHTSANRSFSNPSSDRATSDLDRLRP